MSNPGTNCCGEDGNSFTCGSVANAKARSGLRLLDETAQKNYLIAVQEWVGTTGLPARHPLFFTWTVDPYSDMKECSGCRHRNATEEELCSGHVAPSIRCVFGRGRFLVLVHTRISTQMRGARSGGLLCSTAFVPCSELSSSWSFFSMSRFTESATD